MDLDSRPLRVSDIDAVMSMLQAYDLQFIGEPMMDAEDVLSEWQAPSFDFERDSLGQVDRATGQLVAAGCLTARGMMEIATAPQLKGGPDEVAMIEHFERLARDRAVAEVYQYCAEADESGQALLQGRGWYADYTSWILQLGPDAEIATRELPPGYAVRAFRPGDEHDVYTVICDAFGEWQSHQRSFADWEATVVDRPGGDPTRFRVATFAEDSLTEPVIIGASVVFDGADEAWVAQLAVHRDHRRRGLAQQLLAESYAAARERGVAKGGLSTDSRTGALELYQRLGMHVFCSYVCWKLPITASPA